MTLGLKLSGLPTRVVAVRVSNVPTSTWSRFREQFDATVGWLRARDPEFPPLTLQPDDVTLAGGYLGRGYGEPTAKGRRAQALALDRGGLGLELTYTAKALAAVIDAAAERRDQTLLFWHTHSRVEPSVGDVDPRDLPRELRGYL